MAHNHSQGGDSNLHSLIISILLNSIIVLTKFIGGIISNSLTLISDAMHDLTDVISLVFALFGEIVGKKKPDKKHTFAYKRAEVIIAFVNAIALLLVGLYIIYEAASRFFEKQLEIDAGLMFWIAVVGFAGNLISVLFLHKDKDENLNKKAAYLHILFDVIASLIVIISGVIIYYTHWYSIDLIASIIIALFVIKGGWGVLMDSLHILMQGVPENMDFDEIMNTIKAVDGVEDIHDFHIWNIDSNDSFFSAHIVVKEKTKKDDIIEKINKILDEKFDIHHTSLQVVEKNCC